MVEKLNVERHARVSVVIGVVVSLVVFVLFAYLPGTEESLLFWAALAFVLAFAIVVLLVSILVGREAYHLAIATDDADSGRRSPITIAAVVGLFGWIGVPVVTTLLAPAVPETPVVALTAGFASLTVGAVGTAVVAALSLETRWHPSAVVGGSVVYTAVVVVPGLGAQFRIDTPDRLVAAALSLDPAGVSPLYAAVVVAGGLAVGFFFGVRKVAPAHGFVVGTVAAISALPIVAATGDTVAIRASGIYLPILLGGVCSVGAAVGTVVARQRDRDDWMSG